MTREPDSTVRDELARDRTHLANERTLLAYIRTSIGLVAGSVAIAHLYVGPGGLWMAGGLMAGGVLMIIVGVKRYRTVRSHLRRPPSVEK